MPSVGDISTSSGDVSTLNITGHDVSGSDKLLVVFLAHESTSESATSVTWDPSGVNESLIERRDFSPSHGKNRVEVWFLANPSDVTKGTVQVSMSDTGKVSGIAITLNGVDTSDPIRADAADGQISSSPSITVTSVSGDLVLDGGGNFFKKSQVTPGSGQTERWDYNVMGTFRSFGSTEPAVGASTAMTWTMGELKEWGLVGISVRALGN